MQAFHNDPEIKTQYLDRVHAHFEADEIVQGFYWRAGKGCAVGCTIHDSSHKRYETELGIPEWLARVEDALFEGMSNQRARLWPREFLEAIPVGANLDSMKAPFLIFILKRTLRTFDHAKYPAVKKAINRVIELYKRGETDLQKFIDASANAASANATYANATYANATYATYATYAASANATYAASAAAAATYATYATTATATYAAEATAATYAATYAAYARQKEYAVYANQLLKLLRATK